MIKRRLVEHIRRRERRIRDKGDTQRSLSNTHFTCLFVYETESASKQYRVDHACISLEQIGLRCKQISLQALDTVERFHWLQRVQLVVLHRLPWTLSIRALIDGCKRWKTPVILDLDDAIHDVSVYRQSAVYDHLNKLEKRIHDDLSKRIGRSLDAADAVTVSTKPLAEMMESLQKPVFLIPNRVSGAMIDLTRHSNTASRTPCSIGYMSGTATHHRDFAMIASSVAKLMSEHDDLRLVIAGPLELPDALQSCFASRIQRLPLRDWPDFLTYYRMITVNMAPLENNNLFCSAKSGIKFLEAALSETPTVASPIPDFKRLIDHDQTGLLAETENQWARCLEACIHHPDTAREMGTRAHQAVVNHETVTANNKRWQTVLDRLDVTA